MENLLSYDAKMNQLRSSEAAVFEDKQFLQSDNNSIHITALASYPRSGNTLIRTFIEKITGVYTGSDCDLKRNLNR